MAAEVDIYNMAIGHLGVQQRISSISEKSAIAAACRTFYPSARDTILRKAKFAFSRKFKALGLVEDDPTSEWAFSYRYPNDALLVRRIFSGERNDTEDSKVPYLIGQDDSGLLLYCNLNEVEIEFTSKCENTAVFQPDVALGISYLLASLIGPAVASDDSKMADRAFKLYEYFINGAIVADKAEDKPDASPVDSFTRSRG